MAKTPSLDGVRRARAEAKKEEAFWRDHYGAFLKQYPDQFLAVIKDTGQVVAADPDLLCLIATLSKLGVDVGHVWVRYLAHTPINLAL